MTLETLRDGSWIRTGEERLMSHANRLARVHQNLQLEGRVEELKHRKKNPFCRPEIFGGRFTLCQPFASMGI